jgi:hypothetical protein
MTTLQKILCGMGIFAILYMFATTTTGESRRVLTVKYNDNLYEYTCHDAKEHETIMLKDRHDILYFDGESFFDEAPTTNTKKVSQAKIAKDVSKIIGGDMTDGQLGGLVFLIALCTLIVCCCANPSNDSYDYDY